MFEHFYHCVHLESPWLTRQTQELQVGEPGWPLLALHLSLSTHFPGRKAGELSACFCAVPHQLTTMKKPQKRKTSKGGGRRGEGGGEKRGEGKRERKKQGVETRRNVACMCTYLTCVSISQSPLKESRKSRIITKCTSLPALPWAPGAGSRMLQLSSRPGSHRKAGL